MSRSPRREPTSPAAGVRPLLGRGRSAVVHLETAPDGSAVAAKTFRGDTAADAVHLLFTGAPNPYRWCRDAVECAFLRRVILAALVRFWFGDRLVVAEALGTRWDARQRAWVLETRFLRGAPVALHHPFSAARDHEQLELRRQIMAPLQQHLADAGFDGLLWQAGLGNPVAANNFLVLERRRSRGSDGTRWAWVDLESGVPALLSPDPRVLVGTYLPLCRKHGRPLFDDVDTRRVAAYLNAHAERIRRTLGAAVLADLRERTRRLAEAQRRWRGLSRLERSVNAALAAGRVDPDTARHYLEHPWRWTVREGSRLILRGVEGTARRLRRGVRYLLRAPWYRWVSTGLALLRSPHRRRRAVRCWLLRRVRAWRARGQLTARECAALRRLAADEVTAGHLNDLAVHLALKPLYKPLALLGFPVLAEVGLLPWSAAALGVLFAGSVCRSLYTGWRCCEALARRRRPPLVALAVGVAPLVGAAAFPLQILRTGTSGESRVAAFLLYDLIGGMGRRLPVWGGEDTATEHFFNRLADRLVPRRTPLLAPVAPRPTDSPRHAAST